MQIFIYIIFLAEQIKLILKSIISLTDTIGYKQGTRIRETVKKGTIFEVVGTNSSKSYFSLLSYQCHPLNLDDNIDYTFFPQAKLLGMIKNPVG